MHSLTVYVKQVADASTYTSVRVTMHSSCVYTVLYESMMSMLQELYMCCSMTSHLNLQESTTLERTQNAPTILSGLSAGRL